MQDGQHNLKRWLFFDGMLIDGDASTVVAHSDPAVGEQRHTDVRGVTGHSFIDRVVDHLVHQVVETALAGGPDVHTGALPNSVKPLKDGDVTGVVRHGW